MLNEFSEHGFQCETDTEKLHLFSHAIGLLYDGVCSPDGFYPFLGLFKEMTQSLTATLTIHNVNTRELMGGYFHSMSEKTANWYLEEFSDKDPLTELALSSPHPQFYASNLDVVNIDEVLREIGMDRWLDDCGGAYGASALVQQNSHYISFVTLMRGPNVAPFSREEIEFFNLFIPHIRRAVMLQDAVRKLNTQHQPLSAVLNKSQAPIFIFDHEHRITYCNPAAEKLIVTDAVYQKKQGKLILASGKLQQQFSNALDKAIGACVDPDQMSQCVVQLEDQAVEIKVGVTLSALKGSEQWIGGDVGNGGAMAIFHIEHPFNDVSVSLFEEFFEFSFAEAKLCVELCKGLSLEEASEQMNKSMATLRTQLRSIFRKTGTRKQSELIALVYQYFTLY